MNVKQARRLRYRKVVHDTGTVAREFSVTVNPVTLILKVFKAALENNSEPYVLNTVRALIEHGRLNLPESGSMSVHIITTIGLEGIPCSGSNCIYVITTEGLERLNSGMQLETNDIFLVPLDCLK